MADLPDWSTQVQGVALEASSFRSGLDADKPAAPAVGEIWLARDTFYLYVCNTAGSWDKVAKLYLELTGGTMSGVIAMGTKKITGLGDPTAAQDAATKTYVDAADVLRLLLAGGTMSGAIAMGNNKITGLGAPTLTADAARKTDVDTVSALLDDVSVAQPSRAIDTIYQNGAKILVVTVEVSLTASTTEGAQVNIGSTSPPGTILASLWHTSATGHSERQRITFIVPPSWYYSLTTLTPTPTIQKWTEFTLF